MAYLLSSACSLASVISRCSCCFSFFFLHSLSRFSLVSRQRQVSFTVYGKSEEHDSKRRQHMHVRFSSVCVREYRDEKFHVFFQFVLICIYYWSHSVRERMLEFTTAPRCGEFLTRTHTHTHTRCQLQMIIAC